MSLELNKSYRLMWKIKVIEAWSNSQAKQDNSDISNFEYIAANDQ